MAEGLQPGDVVANKLEVIRKIAGGGMGAVYEVEHKLTKHRRALKILHKSQALNRRHVERLLREASVAGRLDTPYVVETLDAGLLEDGAPYVLMELLEGRALLELIENEAPLDVARTLRIIRQVCDGMAAAHAAGIIHRDLKPENILIEEGPDGRERIKIIDFGISHFREHDADGPVTRLTTEGTIIGTPYYMSPEQASGKDVDERTDVYALGVILYEALTGRLPFIAETTGALFIKIGTGEYLPLRHRRRDIDPELADVVERAFHKEIDERFASAQELADALAPYVDGRRVSDKPRRATADYESDPPRKATSPGIAPGGSAPIETIDAESMAVAERQPIAVRGPSQADRDEADGAPDDRRSPAVGPRPVSRDAPTEELESGPSQSFAIPPTADSSAEEEEHEDAPISERPPARRVPQWLGTTSVAAVIAAIVAVTIVGVGSFGQEPRESNPQPVQERVPEVTPTVDIVEVVDPTLAEVTDPSPQETEETEETEGDEADETEDENERPGPSMRRGPWMATTMAGMETAAEAAGLESDPYAP